MTTYNGHRSWAYWNVALWIGSDEELYNLALGCIRSTKTRREAAQTFLESLRERMHRGDFPSKDRRLATPDGALYSVDKIVAAMRGMT